MPGHPPQLGHLLLHAAALVALAPAGMAQGAFERYVERDGRDWYVVEPHGRFRVNPEVPSLRFCAPIQGFAEFAAAAAEKGLPLPALEPLRSNRLGVHDLRIADGTDVYEALAAIRATGLVEFAEENTFGRFTSVPNDPSFAQQWALRNTGQSGGTPGADIGAVQAWDTTSGIPSIVVAVLDSGLEITHPDLAERIWVNPGEIPGNGLDDDGNGFVDDLHGWNFIDGNGDVTGPFFHGTAVAGIAGASTNNGVGIAGVAGGFGGGTADGCRLMGVRVGTFSVDGTIVDDAILYAADNGARIITMSFTIAQSTAVNLALDHAWNTAGAFLDAASGNNGGPVLYPASNPHVVAVAASDQDDTAPAWSNSGPEVFLAAPGVDILSTSLAGGYTVQSGTSLAAPHVAGVAALVYSVLPATSNASVKEILRITAKDIGPPGFDDDAGWGRVDAFGAVREAAEHDCNQNGVWDPEDIQNGTSQDTNGDGIPDECGCAAATAYCTGAQNSVGPGATIWFTGSQSVVQNDLVLEARGLPPGAIGVFHYGRDRVRQPFGEGFRCVGGGIFRLGIATADGAGLATHALDIDAPPGPAGQISAGDLWRFQHWYLDAAGGPAGFNLTNALEVHFCP